MKEKLEKQYFLCYTYRDFKTRCLTGHFVKTLKPKEQTK